MYRQPMYILPVLYIIFQHCLGENFLQIEGTTCTSSGTFGTCQRVKNCSIALKSIIRTGSHEQKRCGFAGLDELVCCPSIHTYSVSLEDHTTEATVSDIVKNPPEGSTCTSSGTFGTCQRVKNCPTTVESIIRTGKHEQKRCGYVGLDELVCCPSIDTNSISLEDHTTQATVSDIAKNPPEGSICTSSGTFGTCQRVKNCSTAHKSIIKTGSHEQKRCGFVGLDELVCCPSIDTNSISLEDHTTQATVSDIDKNYK